MKSRTTERFRRLLAAAPAAIQEKTRVAYRVWAQNPSHPSLRFKRIQATQPIYSVRIDLDWRAVGVMRDSEVIWFWIGPHDEYELLLKQIHEPNGETWTR